MAEQQSILIIEDMEENQLLLEKIFQEKYEILKTGSGTEAVSIIEKEKEHIYAILLDIAVNEMKGYDILKTIRSKDNLRNIPIIMISDDKAAQTEYKCLSLGAYDFINKPLEPDIVKARVENAVELYRYKNRLELLVSMQVNKLNRINDDIINTLSTLMEFRDVDSGNHICRVKMLTGIILKSIQNNYPEYKLNEKRIQMIQSASVLHDVGKIAIPDKILLKPGKLTEDEVEIMKGHSCKGEQIINKFQFVDNEEYCECCCDICRHHHERFDGNGYPDGLKGEEISIGAQAVSLADVYDALVNDRVYKRAYPHEDAQRMIVHGECGVFNPKLIKCFEECFEELVQIEQEYAD